MEKGVTRAQRGLLQAEALAASGNLASKGAWMQCSAVHLTGQGFVLRHGFPDWARLGKAGVGRQEDLELANRNCSHLLRLGTWDLSFVRGEDGQREPLVCGANDIAGMEL